MNIRKCLRINPKNPTGDKIFYWMPASRPILTQKEFVERLSRASSMHKGDIAMILALFTEELISYLKDGVIVDMGTFGRFCLSIESKAKNTEEELTKDDIEKIKILFKPGIDLKHAINSKDYISELKIVS